MLIIVVSLNPEFVPRLNPGSHNGWDVGILFPKDEPFDDTDAKLIISLNQNSSPKRTTVEPSDRTMDGDLGILFLKQNITDEPFDEADVKLWTT